MLKVIIADDEDIIREGLIDEVNWLELGLEIIGEAESGRQVLDIIQKCIPDIIITDIKMPFINGLELIEIVKEKYPSCYIIIISGYDEFKYAQKALKLGAYDYILKPIELDYLYEILLKIKKDYSESQKKNDEMNNLKVKVEENIPYVKEMLFRKIVFDSIGREEIYDKLGKLEMDIKDYYFISSIIQIDENDIIIDGTYEDRKKLIKFLEEILIYNNFKYDDRVIFKYDSFSFVVCFFGKHKVPLESKVREVCSIIQKKCIDKYNFTVTITVGSSYSTIYKLKKSFFEAESTLNYVYIIGKGKVINYVEMDHNIDIKNIDIDFNILDFVSLIKTGDKETVKKSICLLKKVILSKGENSYLYMQIIISSVYMEVLKTIKEFGGDIREVFKNPMETYKKIMEYITVEDMLNELNRVFLKVMDYIDVKRYGKFDYVMEKAKVYINKNYSNAELSLKDVSNHVNMSFSYFSMMFKREIGESYIEYITRIRIEKSKEFLRFSGYKSYEISYMVGYDNPTYFSTTFKKMVGMSPTDYKNKFLKK